MSKKLLTFTYKQLIKCKLHVGYKTKVWYGYFASLIMGYKDLYYYINLDITVLNLRNSLILIERCLRKNLNIFLVLTKKILRDRVESEFYNFQSYGVYYVNARWFGGFLTGFKVFFKKFFVNVNLYGKYNKNNELLLDKEQKYWLRYYRNYKGIRFCKLPPSFLFVFSGYDDKNSIRESYKTGIPSGAVLDTVVREGPLVTYKIPGNEISQVSNLFYVSIIKNGLLLGILKRKKFFYFFLKFYLIIYKRMDYKKLKLEIVNENFLEIINILLKSGVQKKNY